jgi:hypothetical protein
LKTLVIAILVWVIAPSSPYEFDEQLVIKFKDEFKEQTLALVNAKSSASRELPKKADYLAVPVCYLSLADASTSTFETIGLVVRTNTPQSYLIARSKNGTTLLQIYGKGSLSDDLEGSIEIKQLVYVEKHLSPNPFVLTFPNLDTTRYVGFFQAGSIYFLNPRTLQPQSIEDVIIDTFGSRAKFLELMHEQRIREALKARVSGWTAPQLKSVLQTDYLCYSKAFFADTAKVLDLFVVEVRDSLGLTNHQANLLKTSIKNGIRKGTLMEQLTPIWFYGYDISFPLKRVLTNDQYQQLSLIHGRKRFLCSRAEGILGNYLSSEVFTEDGQYTTAFVKFVFEK